MTSADLEIGRQSEPAGARFDDMLATMLARPLDTHDARVSAWRQVVDLLGQGRSGEPSERLEHAYDLIGLLRGEVPAAIRADTARSICRWHLPARLIAFFAGDDPAIAGPVLAGASLPDADWLALLPNLSPSARQLVRERPDLSPAVARALARSGAGDCAPAGLAPAGSAPAPREDPLAGPAHFRFETGADGVVLWVEDAPRGPLIGIAIGQAAVPSDPGVDEQAADAFRRCAPFRNSRLWIVGAGPVAGEWRISAVPFFDAVDARLLGYRGSARRPNPATAIPPGIVTSGLHGSALPADSLRQVVHELRTPLNAIVGFAEMIERQMLGPAARPYRRRAAEISGHGRRLLATVDDLDVSARLESRRITFDRGTVDAALLLARLWPDQERIALRRGVVLAVTAEENLPLVDGDPVAMERMFARLFAATLGFAEAKEKIAIRLDSTESDGKRFVRLYLTRPHLPAAQDERGLLDPGYEPEGEWPDAPLLGLGFTLRLVGNLALAAGGSLTIGDDAFVLRLPAQALGSTSVGDLV